MGTTVILSQLSATTELLRKREVQKPNGYRVNNGSHFLDNEVLLFLLL